MTHLNKIMLNFTLLFKTQKGNNENRNIVVRKKYRNIIIVRKLDLLKCARSLKGILKTDVTKCIESKGPAVIPGTC